MSGQQSSRIHFHKRTVNPWVSLLTRVLVSVSALMASAIIVYSEAESYHDANGDGISFLDAIYFSTVSLSTTGFGDIYPVTDSARLVNTVVITPLRFIFLSVLVSTTVEALSKRGREALRVSRWRSVVNNHTIVIGYGIKGRTALKTLIGSGVKPSDIVVITADGRQVDDASKFGCVVVHGDAHQEDVLLEAVLADAAEARRALPWVRLAQDYVFDTPEGPQRLADLFQGRGQLLVQHFMFGPGWEQGCKSCSFWADGFDGIITHLNQRDVAMVCVSAAPLEKLMAFRQCMGWRFEWVSSTGTAFNNDFGVAGNRGETLVYNYERAIADAGAFGMVLECLPATLAASITSLVKVPTIGIGAGPHCDGQVLVLYDLLGLFDEFVPKFVKPYAHLKADALQALRRYKEEVEQGKFPSDAESYH